MENSNEILPPSPQPAQLPPETKKWYQHKGIITVFVLAILVVIASWVYFAKQSKPNVTPIVVGSFQTYTNQQYGFNFQYPTNWKLMTDANGQAITLDANIPAGGGLTNTSALVIKMRIVNDSDFGVVHADPNDIGYDSSKNALMDVTDNPPVCQPFNKQAGLFSENPIPVNLPIITYGGSLMSDPVSVNYAILTNKGYIILIDEAAERTGNSSEDTAISSGEKQFFSSLQFMNGIQAQTPGCVAPSASAIAPTSPSLSGLPTTPVITDPPAPNVICNNFQPAKPSSTLKHDLLNIGISFDYPSNLQPSGGQDGGGIIDPNNKANACPRLFMGLAGLTANNPDINSFGQGYANGHNPKNYQQINFNGMSAVFFTWEDPSQAQFIGSQSVYLFQYNGYYIVVSYMYGTPYQPIIDTILSSIRGILPAQQSGSANINHGNVFKQATDSTINDNVSTLVQIPTWGIDTTIGANLIGTLNINGKLYVISKAAEDTLTSDKSGSYGQDGVIPNPGDSQWVFITGYTSTAKKVYEYNLNSGELSEIFSAPSDNNTFTLLGMDGSKLIFESIDQRMSPGPCNGNWQFGDGHYYSLDLANTGSGLLPYSVPAYQVQKDKQNMVVCTNNLQ